MENEFTIDRKAVEDLVMLTEDARNSIQDAYFVERILDHLIETGGAGMIGDMPEYRDLIFQCLERISTRLEKYCLGFVPEDPFEKK